MSNNTSGLFIENTCSKSKLSLSKLLNTSRSARLSTALPHQPSVSVSQRISGGIMVLLSITVFFMS
nr:MAG TPA: hypothetical protein [Caudoviricetes sp.]